MSCPIAPVHYDRSNFEHYDELGTDFFDQFLTFETIDNNSSVDSRQTANSSTDHVPSSTPNGFLGWGGEFRAFGQDSTSSESIQGPAIYSEMTGRAAISDSELLSLGGINLDSTKDEIATLHSLPSSPLQMNEGRSRKKQFAESMSRRMKRSTSNFEKSLRSPIRKGTPSPKTIRTKSTSIEHAVDLLKFEFDFEKSPAITSNEKSTNGIECSFETLIPTQLSDLKPSRHTGSRTRSADVLTPSTPPQEYHTNRWPPRLPLAIDMDPYGSSTIYTSENDTPVWWNHASTAPMAQPSPTALHINPQRATKSLAYQLQHDLSRGDNTIVFDPSTSEELVPQKPNGSAKQLLAVDSFSGQQNYIKSVDPHHRSRQQANSQFYSRRHMGHYLPPPRRNAPPASESDSPSPRSYQVRKRKTPRKERSSVPRAPSLVGAVDFVNFTPSDSKKILTGVAPSGSSKTKARREKEAMEKRRKLSQAAVRAVRAAGGDVESLVEQGLLV